MTLFVIAFLLGKPADLQCSKSIKGTVVDSSICGMKYVPVFCWQEECMSQVRVMVSTDWLPNYQKLALCPIQPRLPFHHFPKLSPTYFWGLNQTDKWNGLLDRIGSGVLILKWRCRAPSIRWFSDLQSLVLSLMINVRQFSYHARWIKLFVKKNASYGHNLFASGTVRREFV